MNYAYYNCKKISGFPKCGNNVINMFRAYYECQSIYGTPACGPKVTDMSYAYYGCYTLDGMANCGNNVEDMTYTYAYCSRLAGAGICEANVTKMQRTYYSCKNLRMAFILSDKINYSSGVFGGRNYNIPLNIIINKNSVSLNSFLYNNTSSIIGNNITWTEENNSYYNTTYNIYIYPVDNVRQHPQYIDYLDKKNNLLIDFDFILNGDGTYTITCWKGTY